MGGGLVKLNFYKHTIIKVNPPSNNIFMNLLQDVSKGAEPAQVTKTQSSCVIL